LNGTIPDPLGLPLPQDWGFETPTQRASTPIAIISGMGKATDFKFGQYIHRVHPNESLLEILEKGERGRISGAHFIANILLTICQSQNFDRTFELLL